MVVTLILFAIAHPASADFIYYSKDFSKEYSNCMENSSANSPTMRNCVSAETVRQDIRLNKAYKKIMEQISGDRKEQLRNAQRYWIKFRDAKCSYYDSYPNPGTMDYILANQCIMFTTTLRANELEFMDGF